MDEEAKRPDKKQKVEHQFDGKFTLRSYDPVKDLESAAQAALEAFRAASTPSDFPTLESVKDVFRQLAASKENQGVVAVDSNGKIVGSNFLEFSDNIAGVGPISVIPTAQKQRVGSALQQYILDIVKTKSPKAVHVATPTETANFKLLSAYGFKQAVEISDMRGFIPSGTTLPRGYNVRVMTANDVYACDQLIAATVGYSRKNKLLNSLKGPYPRFVVMHDDHDLGSRIVGFTTGLHLGGCTVAESDDALKSLIITYSQSYEYIVKTKKEDGEDSSAADDKSEKPSAVVQVPTQHTAIAKWLTEQGFRVHGRRFIGVYGKHQDSKHFYLPSLSF